MRFGERVERAIAQLAPTWAAKREYARQSLAMAERMGARSFYGASSNERTSDWSPLPTSADEDAHDLPELRQRSRDLIRNNSFASSIQACYVTNVVGDGVKTQSQVRADEVGIDSAQEGVVRDEVDRAWRRWCEAVDAGLSISWEELQRLCVAQIVENGEVFLVRRQVRRRNSRVRLAWQPIEADRVESPNNIDTERIVHGIEKNEAGRVIAYHIRDTHPGDYRKVQQSYETTRVPARDPQGRPNVIHLFRKTRPGQRRGYPLLSPVLEIFNDLDQYREAELVSARVAACFTAFVKRNNPYTGRDVGSRNSDGNYEMSPGAITYLSAGEDVTLANPMRPNSVYAAFCEDMKRDIATGVHLPYEMASRAWNGTTYTSGRMSLLEARDQFRIWQSLIKSDLCKVVFSLFVEDAFLAGELDLPRYYDNQEAWATCYSIGRGWPWVDPTKEVNAAKIGLEINSTTLADVVGQNGGDWQDTLRQAAAEKSLREELGLAGAPITVPPSPNPEPPEDEEQDDDDEGDAPDAA